VLDRLDELYCKSTNSTNSADNSSTASNSSEFSRTYRGKRMNPKDKDLDKNLDQKSVSSGIWNWKITTASLGLVLGICIGILLPLRRH
jgi:hypothetical protein